MHSGNLSPMAFSFPPGPGEEGMWRLAANSTKEGKKDIFLNNRSPQETNGIL
jgi:hypothetical protein